MIGNGSAERAVSESRPGVRRPAAAPGPREVGPTGNRFLCFSPCTKSSAGTTRKKKPGGARRRRCNTMGRVFRFIDGPTRIGTSVRLYTRTRARHLFRKKKNVQPLYIYRPPSPPPPPPPRAIVFIYKDAALGFRV